MVALLRSCLLVVTVSVAGAVVRPVLARSIFTPAAPAQIGLVCGHWHGPRGGLLCDWWLVTLVIFIILAYMQEQVKRGKCRK